MAITASELKLYKSQGVSASPAANGGRISATEIISSVANNLFPDVPQAERLAGSTTLRKFFFKNANNANLALYNSKVFIENYTPGDDAVYMLEGTPAGMESELTGTEKVYGASKLDASVSVGATVITVLLESASVQFFKAGDSIRISDKVSVDAAGNEEFRTISGAPGYAGSIATITLNAPLTYGFAAAATRVANILAFGDLAGTVSNLVATSAGGGTYDNTAQPITVPNVAGVYEDWTVSFTSATTFSVVGAREGAVGSGSTLSDFSPVNPATSTPFFTIKALGFTGSWATGNTLAFRTTPASIPLWAKRVIPPNAGAITGNRAVFGITGETA